MKWAVLSALLLMFFGNLSGHETPRGISGQPTSSAVDIDQNTVATSANFDLPALDNIFGDFEEEEEKEEEEDQFYFHSNFCLPPFSMLFFFKATVAPFVPRQLQVKLFILYQSWKSFLLV